MHELNHTTKNSHLINRQQGESSRLGETRATVGGFLYGNEIWKDIKGYEGLYQVSNYGRMKSLARRQKSCYGSTQFIQEIIMKFKADKDGYYSVCLVNLGIKKWERVYRLVGKMFIDNFFNKPCINHIDNNVQNNKVNNLEWVTIQENKNWSIKCGRQRKGEQINSNKLTEKQILEIRKICVVDGRKYRNKKVKGVFKQIDLAKKYKVSQAEISSIIRRTSWKYL